MADPVAARKDAKIDVEVGTAAQITVRAQGVASMNAEMTVATSAMTAGAEVTSGGVTRTVTVIKETSRTIVGGKETTGAGGAGDGHLMP